MPAYNTAPTSAQVPVVSPSIPILVWDADLTIHASPAAPSSQQFCFQRDGHLPNVMSAQVSFSGAPGTFELEVQTSDTDDDNSYVTKGSITAVNVHNVGRIELTNIVAKFGRLNMKTLQNTVAATVRVQ